MLLFCILQYIGQCELHPCLADLELKLPAFAAHRIRKLAVPRVLIEEIDTCPSPPPRPKTVKLSQSIISKVAPPLSQVVCVLLLCEHAFTFLKVNASYQKFVWILL